MRQASSKPSAARIDVYGAAQGLKAASASTIAVSKVHQWVKKGIRNRRTSSATVEGNEVVGVDLDSLDAFAELFIAVTNTRDYISHDDNDNGP